MLSRRRAERHSLPLAWHQLAFRGDLVASRRPGRNASLDSSLADHAMQLNMTSKHGSSLKAVFLLARPLLPAADPCQYGSCPDELKISLKSKKSRSPVSLHLRSCGPHSPVSKKAPNSLDDQYAAWLVRASTRIISDDQATCRPLTYVLAHDGAARQGKVQAAVRVQGAQPSFADRPLQAFFASRARHLLAGPPR